LRIRTLMAAVPVIAATGWLLAVAAPVRAQEPPPQQPPTTEKQEKPSNTGIDPAARDLLNRVLAAYDGLKSISIKVDTTGQSGKDKLDAHLTADVQTPYRIHVKTPKGEAVSDGMTLYIYRVNAPTYTKEVMPTGGETKKWLISRINNAGLGVQDSAFIDILRGDPFFKDFPEMPGFVSMAIGGTETVDNVTTQKIVFTASKIESGTLTLTLFVGPDNLLRRITAEGKIDDNTVNVTENHTILSLNPTFAPQTFKFVPPSGVKEATQAPVPKSSTKPAPKPTAKPKPKPKGSGSPG
jgi:outer membrane lipoprotein-sorting protein